MGNKCCVCFKIRVFKVEEDGVFGIFIYSRDFVELEVDGFVCFVVKIVEWYGKVIVFERKCYVVWFLKCFFKCVGGLVEVIWSCIFRGRGY